MKYFVGVTLIVLNIACIALIAPQIESRIQHGAEQAVAQFEWASVTADGRTVRVHGTAPLSERALAERRLRGVTLASDIVFTSAQMQHEED